MASFGEFDRRMRVVAAKVNTNAERHVRRAALIADQVVVTATPVDTGRARANWVTSIGVPVFQNKEPSGPDAGTGAIAQGRQAIAGWRIGSGPIFISNGVSYITYLNDGSSAQAPEGMTSQAVQATRAYLRKARLL